MRKSSVVFGVISVAAVLSAAWSGWQLHIEREKIALLEHRLAISSPPATRASVPASSSIARIAPASLSAVVPSAPTDAAPDPEIARQKEFRKLMRASQEHEREMMRDPAYRKARVDEWRRRSAQTRADAIRVVGLAPDQADRLIDLLIEQNMRSSELFDPSDTHSDEVQAQLKRMGEANQARLRELLGEEKFERWNWYQASGGERSEVSQFRAQLATSPEPLQERQADALVETIYSERRRRTREYEDYVSAAGITDRNVVSPQDRQRWLDLEKEANQRIHDSMSGDLTQVQLASLDEMLAANVAPIEAALRLQLEGKLAKAP